MSFIPKTKHRVPGSQRKTQHRGKNRRMLPSSVTSLQTCRSPGRTHKEQTRFVPQLRVQPPRGNASVSGASQIHLQTPLRSACLWGGAGGKEVGTQGGHLAQRRPPLQV